MDFSQLIDLPSPGSPATANVVPDAVAGSGSQQPACPSHPSNDDCLCHGFVGAWDIPEPITTDPLLGLEEPDYSKFENWIPRFTRPEKPCDYCRSRRLNCYFRRGESHCTPCMSLFRECSFSNSQTLEAFNYAEGNSAFLDTLHAVDEDAAKERGAFTGIKPLASKAYRNGTSTPVRGDDAPGSTKRNGIRFPRHAVKTLRDWLDAHPDHPYPTEEQKVELEKKTELKPSQITNWLANARRRRKITDNAKPRLCVSPSLKPATPPIAIPGADKPWDELNPLERWKHSPPENEPASITDIVHAVANSELPDDQSSRSPSSGRRKRSSNGSGFSSFRAPSTTSLNTSNPSTSLSASSAAYSQVSSQSFGSFGSFSSGLAGKRDRRRRRRPAPPMTRKPAHEKSRIFQCTFCTDTFKSKYDWTRHEKSLHLSLEKWICAPLGPIVVDPESGEKKCVYCDALNPTDDHVESHNHRQCENKGLDARTFYRKDHLRQHLRLMHGCQMTSFMDNWKSIACNINSRCGFCAQRFTVWQERVDHLTAHFKAGARMVEWKGCRGLDPAVAAQVTNAMPPYLIGMESVSPNPFSASNSGAWRQNCTMEHAEADLVNFVSGDIHHPPGLQESSRDPKKATCWEILTVRLGKYATEMAQKGIVLSDEMLQQQARRIEFDSDDAWNQTAADNPEWLDLFKKAHGLDFIPAAIGGEGLHVPEDLETYGDLGLRVPFSVQLKAYQQDQSENRTSSTGNGSDTLNNLLKQRESEFRGIYSLLSKEGVLLQDEHINCDHAECSNNIIDISSIDNAGDPGPRLRRWCTYSIAPENAARLLMAAAGDFAPSTDKQTAQHQRNVTEGLKSLCKLYEKRGDQHEVATQQEQSAAAGARAQSLLRLTEAEAYCCGHVESNAREEAARSRARGLAALARVDAPIHDCDCDAPLNPSRIASKTYLRRHKFQLPKERANNFETVTGPWKDSGIMPDPVYTAADGEGRTPCYPTRGTLVPMPSVAEQSIGTSTGAMMEFLGGQIGAHLPFSQDAATSTVTPPTMAPADMNFIFDRPDHMDEFALKGLDRLPEVSMLTGQPTSSVTAMEQESNIFQPNFATSVHDGIPSNTALDIPMDEVIDDFDFDDITFDGVFDMPIDDTFGADGSM